MNSRFRNIPGSLLLLCLLFAGWAKSVEASGARTELSAGLPFTIEEHAGKFWLTKPGGERFFSFGVCKVDQGAPLETFKPENPDYAAWQHYRDGYHWARDTVGRLKSWNVTTIGAWSDFDALRQMPDLDVAFAPVLHIGSTAGVPWWDMWHPTNIARMDAVAREKIIPLRDDPRLIGYYADNEMGWWNAVIFKMTLEHHPSSGQRQRLIHLLRSRYQNDWARLSADFEPEGVSNWAGLEQGGMLYLRPRSDGIHTMRAFLEILAERYYSLVQETIRRYDKRALIMGERFQSFFYPEVAAASSRHLDVVSGNLNVCWIDGTFVRFYPDTLHALTGKPLIMSEFYMAAMQNSTGNKNSSGGFPTVKTQRQRAAGFKNMLRSIASLPYVVGADWFQFADEPPKGRHDGEDFNFGLVDVFNRPYGPLTRGAASLDLGAIKADAAWPRPDAAQGVPRAPRDPFADFRSGRALMNWDRERGFVKSSSKFPLADLYICWDRDSIYLGLYAQDVVEDFLYRGQVLPGEDRAEWVIRIGDSEVPLRARIGAGAEPVLNNPSIRIRNISGKNLNTRNVAAIELPARLFGKTKFKERDVIQFESTLWTHCRAYQYDWHASLVLGR